MQASCTEFHLVGISLHPPTGLADIYWNPEFAFQHEAYPTSFLSLQVSRKRAFRTRREDRKGQAGWRTKLRLSGAFWKHSSQTRPLLKLGKYFPPCHLSLIWLVAPHLSQLAAPRLQSILLFRGWAGDSLWRRVTGPACPHPPSEHQPRNWSCPGS